MEQAGHITGYLVKYWDIFMMYAPSIFGALVVFIIGLWIINLVSHAASRAMLKKELDPSLQTFLSSLISVSLKIVLLITVAGMLGLQTTSFVAILGAAGLAVGFALQGSLANFAGGVLILVFKPFKVGDSIEAQGHTGKVIEIQIFNTILLDADNKTVVLPNGSLSNHTIVNISRHGSLRVEIAINVAPETDVVALMEKLTDLMVSHGKVLKEPVPAVIITKINENSVNLAIRCFTKTADQPDALNELFGQVNNLLGRENIRSASTPKIIVSNTRESSS